MADVALGAVASPALPSTLMAGAIATAGAGGVVSPALGKAGLPTDPFAAMLASLVATDEGKVAVATALPTVQSVLIPQPAALVRAAGAKPAETAVTDPDLLALVAKDGDAAEPDAGDGDTGDETPPDSPLAMMLAIAEPQAPPAAMALPTQITASVSKKVPEQGPPARILASTAPTVAKAKGTIPQPKPADEALAKGDVGVEAAPAEASNPRAALFARLLSGTATPVAAATPEAAAAKPQIDPATLLPPAIDAKAALVTAPAPQASAVASVATSAQPQRAADPAVQPPATPLVSGATAEAQTAATDMKVSRPAIRELNPKTAQPSRAERPETLASPTPRPVAGSGAPSETPAATRPKVDLQTDAVAGLAGQAPAHVASTESPAAPNSAPSAADGIATRTLSIASDTQWLDTLARDIAATAGRDGSMSFRLDPQHLGSLTVHITHGHDGASIRLSADTEAGRAMLTDAQPRLAAEARAQGLTLKETSVDLGGSGAGQSHHQGNASTFASLAQGQSQRDSGRSQTFINPNAGEADEPARADPAPTERSDLFA